MRQNVFNDEIVEWSMASSDFASPNLDLPSVRLKSSFVFRSIMSIARAFREFLYANAKLHNEITAAVAAIQTLAG
jgi:hypothetical protein